MRWLHPDAVDMWKMTMSLSDVVRACADPSKRLPRQASPLATGSNQSGRNCQGLLLNVTWWFLRRMLLWESPSDHS